MDTEATDAISALDRALSPAGLDRQLEGADADECKRRFDLLRGAAATVLVDTAICIGRALGSAGYGDKEAESLAKLFEISRSFIFRWAKIYREIVKPRLDVSGDGAVFPLDDISFYVVSVDRAQSLERPAVELLEHAETERDANRGYSVRDFRDWVDGQLGGDEGSTRSEAAAFDRLLGKLADCGDDVVDEWVKWAMARDDTRGKLARLSDAYSAVDRALKFLQQEMSA